MNCQEVIRELSTYLDGELSDDIRAQLESHLKHCRNCELLVDQTRQTVTLLCNDEPVRLPERLHSRLHAQLREKMALLKR